jgi:hypothetical protein
MIALGHRKKGNEMFVYLVNLTNGKSVRVETAGDPTDHPAFYNRVVSVETLGMAGLHLV